MPLIIQEIYIIVAQQVTSLWHNHDFYGVNYCNCALSFRKELNCQIYMTQRQLHLTGKYHRCLSVSLLQTSQCEYLEYERNKNRLQLKQAARFYNDLLVGKPLTDAVPSPPLQNISEIRWHLPPPTHIATPLPPYPFPKSGKTAKKTYILFVTLTGSW